MSLNISSRRAPDPLDRLSRQELSDLLVTDDLFLAAYAMTEGAQLLGVELVSQGGRPLATFRLAAPGMAQLERAYLDGTAMTNVGSLKRYLKHLKDVLFNRLRNEARR